MDERNQGLSRNRQLELWGILDGVGYSENKAGTINKMLSHFHEHVQMKSTFKIALAMHRLGLRTIRAIRFDSTFYTPASAEQMVERYVPDDVSVAWTDAAVDQIWRPLRAGKAIVYL